MDKRNPLTGDRQASGQLLWGKIQFPKPIPIQDHLKVLPWEKSANVLFEIGGGTDLENCNRTMTSLVNFHAHRLILKDDVPTVYKLCESYDDLTPVLITGVKIFHQLLHSGGPCQSRCWRKVSKRSLTPLTVRSYYPQSWSRGGMC